MTLLKTVGSSLLLVLLISGLSQAQAVDGMMGLETADGHGWLAIRVDFDESYALEGILWYNNDSYVPFPTIAVGTGYTAGPGSVNHSTVMAEEVSGDSDAWSECTFSQPVAASLGGLYVIMEFPSGVGFSERGEGGGPAVGYSSELTEPHGWISGDGETWHPLRDDYGFAMSAVLVPVTEGMFVKSLPADGENHTPVIPNDYYISAGPNPFNPKVVVRFGLPRSGHTTMDVFDVRGRRVAGLLDEVLQAGHHEVSWQGKDTRGRAVASGVYFMKLSSGDMEQSQRVLLVK